ncbi:hypothetical protein AB4259_09760 [Vibrio amylolyticus]|uniref:hypothetical protein n=1 Tax=Vibrio amylolyticus TaxID=2847292 RepID=UPI00354BD04A
MQAKKVLKDSWFAYEKLKASQTEEEFRINWVACLALLRAVGHVLAKVDSKHSSRTKNAIDAWWSQLNRRKVENSIFWEFIDEYRNNIVKEYNLGVHFVPTELYSLEGEEVVNVEHHLISFTDSSENCIELVADSLVWWGVQLSDIQREIGCINETT